MAEDRKGKGVKEEKIPEDGFQFMEVDFPLLNDAQSFYLRTFLCKKTCTTIEEVLDEIGLSRGKVLSTLAERFGERFVRIRDMQRWERTRKKQKLVEEGESSAMGAMGAATSTPTADGDALMVLAFEQRIREVESQRDAFKCAFEKEKAAHNDTMRSLRALQHAVEAVPRQVTRQVTTDEPEARLLQDTTDEPEHL